MDKVLLLNMKYDNEMISNDVTLFVRALPMYSAVDWLKEPVNRCLQHLSPVDKSNKGEINKCLMFITRIINNFFFKLYDSYLHF